MRAPLSWIKEFVEIPTSIAAEEISDALIRVGFEVEEIIKQGSDLTGPLVFAKVLSIEELLSSRSQFVTLDSIVAKRKPVTLSVALPTSQSATSLWLRFLAQYFPAISQSVHARLMARHLTG